MNSVDALRVVKNSLGKCCLAGVNMGTDAIFRTLSRSLFISLIPLLQLPGR
ncbi:hypothetical protein VT98_14441, partial [Candidatus Electrothrix communis]